MKLQDFYFHLPEDRIARFPAEKRDESRLMVVERKSGHISHHLFKDIAGMVGTDDFLVVNNSKVIPVKLFGKIGDGKVELLISKIDRENNQVEALTLPARKFKPGARVELQNHLYAEVVGAGSRGRRVLTFNKSLDEVLNAGFAPLPPYIKRKADEARAFKDFDLARYQTVYSKTPGSIAAPTAGLHFTPGLMAEIRKKTEIIEITLDVGEATFQKIEVEDISRHRMGREYITITRQDRERIRRLKETKHLIAVGTTSVRSLETYALQEPQEETFYSEIFISPGFRFRMADKLITNFHLPESSLFILTAAFGGLELMKEAYRVALEGGYRFFSYGDAMFII
ncbi:MAG: tRNA preQ1(34) S-adenosylmethionine ribosyltransferase-isomerase QueA [Candidatus Aminicenantes bacterium]|nr:tRNA preQ1(34) S-adenosylmethionine ribosyltransferase-isomerase QueA [Candidatus Aminicenantes bacterium]